MQAYDRTQSMNYLVASLPGVRRLVFFSRQHTFSKTKFKRKIIALIDSLHFLLNMLEKKNYKVKSLLSTLKIC